MFGSKKKKKQSLGLRDLSLRFLKKLHLKLWNHLLGVKNRYIQSVTVSIMLFKSVRFESLNKKRSLRACACFSNSLH